MPFPAAAINPILSILKALLGSDSTVGLRLSHLQTEFHVPALHCLLFVSCMFRSFLFFLHKFTVSCVGLRCVCYFKTCNSRAHKVVYLKEPSGEVAD